jgi:hypothetical protein
MGTAPGDVDRPPVTARPAFGDASSAASTMALLSASAMLLPAVSLAAFLLHAPKATLRVPPTLLAAREIPSAARPRLQGRLLDAEGLPVAGAAVRVFSGEPASALATTETDAQGTFAFAVGAQAFTVRAEASAGRTVESAILDPSIHSFVLVLPFPVERHVELRRLPPVHGVVVDPGGRPVRLAQVTACDEPDDEHALSDEQGRFELPSSTIGCFLRAQHPRFAASIAVPIVPRALKVKLQQGGAFDGLATDGRGRPIGSFSVSITSFEPDTGESTEVRIGETFDELRGAFHVDALPPGSYGIAVASDHRPAWTATVHVSSGKVTRGLHAVLGEVDTGSADPSAGSGEPAAISEPDGSESSETHTEESVTPPTE